MMRWVCAIAALLAGAAGAASAGVFIETQERNEKTGAAGATQQIYLQADAARFETPGEDVSILRGDTLTVLDPSAKTYVVVDRAALERMATQMSGAMAQLNAQLAELPPEQRAAMQQMMQGRMPGAAPAPVAKQVVDTGRTETVDGRTCRVWDVTRAGVLVEQHCVVAYRALPGDVDVRAAFERMSHFFQQMAAANPAFAGAGNDFEALTKLDGFPVLTREFEQGKPTGDETHVKTWREEAVAPDRFEVPRDYRKRDLSERPAAR
jgi:hypothetical protein